MSHFAKTVAMKKIFKYPLQIRNSQTILMPYGAEILSLKIQNGIPCIWALVDEKSQLTERRFETYGTGHKIRHEIGVGGMFIDTYYHENGEVYHVFELKFSL